MKNKLKQALEERISKNLIKKDLTYKDKKGNFHTEEVYLKKSLAPLGDWQRIYPPVKNGKINWVNLLFGGRNNLIKTLLILGIIGMVMLQLYENYNFIGILSECCNRCNNITVMP